MRVALGQINSTLGDLSANRQKILSYTHRAVDHRCDLIVFPESALLGYPPMDLLERPSIIEAQLKELERLVNEIPHSISVLVGVISKRTARSGRRYFNSAALLKRNKKTRFFHKELLPYYDVFDEARHISQGDLSKNTFTLSGQNILVSLCADIWAWDPPGGRSDFPENPIKKLDRDKFDLIVNLSASPFTTNKINQRKYVAKKTASYLRAPLVYVNSVGAQDELIFDGGSFALSQQGNFLAQCIYFEEDLNVIDLGTMEGGFRNVKLSPMESLRQALVLGIRDFCEKIGISHVHLGLSGGIDSAVVACLAADAMGPQNVTCIGLPGPFNAPESLTLAHQLSDNLHAHWNEIPIEEIYDVTLRTFQTSLEPFDFGVTNENLQARIRGLLLMAFSNLNDSLLLATSNKSEFATGYSTLYGDMCGGLAPLGDLLKRSVYELAGLYNEEYELIPKRIVKRPPSAELKPDQTDEDSLPPYDQLDASVENLVEKRAPTKNNTDRWVLRAMMRSEHKRWQAPPILKVSDHAFGRGRRLPIAHKAKV